MPIETAIEQAAIADSLIDTNPETNGALGSVSDLYDRVEAGNTFDENGLSPEDYEQGTEAEAPEQEQDSPDADQVFREYDEQRREEIAQELANEQLEAAPKPGLEQFDAVIEKFELSDPRQGQALAQEFLAAFPGIPSEAIAGMDAGQFQRTMNYTALSLGGMYDSVGGDLSRLPAFDVAQAGQKWGNDFLASFGVDSRTVEFDAQQLGEAIFEGGFNILRTFDAMGRNGDVRQLNSPEAAMYFYEKFARAFGNDGPINRAEAVKIADVFAKAILAPIQKLGQTPAPASRPQRAQQSQRRSTSGRRRSAPPRFQTNTDIFDTETLERIANEGNL